MIITFNVIYCKIIYREYVCNFLLQTIGSTEIQSKLLIIHISFGREDLCFVKKQGDFS